MTSILSRFSSQKQGEGVTYEPDLPNHFVDWPQGEKGHPLQDLEVSLSVDELLDALFGNAAAVGEACRKRQGSHDYIETAWMPNESEARQAFAAKASKHVSNSTLTRVSLNSSPDHASAQNGNANIRTGYCRMNMSNSTHLGRIAHNVELERCLASAAGSSYEVQVCVCSTAPMADRFRCIFNHKLTHVSKSKSRWTARYAMVFVEKTNFLIRKPIEAGAQGAIKSNFTILADLLKQHASGKI